MTQAATSPTRVVIVDGHPVFAESLAIAMAATGELTCVAPALVHDVASWGAAGLLPKSTGLDVVVATIPALGGHTFAVDRQSLIDLVATSGAPALRRSSDSSPLTGREQDILSLLARGVDLQTAAGRLGITVNTARGYVKNLYRKLGVHNQLELLAVARERGLLEPGE